MLENTERNLSASIRSYLINILNSRVALHPPDYRTDIVRNMLRDIGMATMADEAAKLWGLPKLNSGRQRSAAWFVAAVMSKHGVELSERQVRRLVQTYCKGFGKRLAAFLLAGAVE
jgi:hypothetical protein